MTINAAIQALTASPAVRDVRRWQGGSTVRHYVTLMHVDRGFRGDATLKIWIDERAAELIIEPGRGTMSTAGASDLSAVRDLARTLGRVTREYGDSVALTVKLGG